MTTTTSGHATPPTPVASRGSRQDGYVPLGQYAVLGNGETVALVASDGRVDWWPSPALDSTPAFAAVLDPAHGGYLELRPEGSFEVTRTYVGDSNVVQTTFTTATGSVRVTDALTVGRAGRLPWGELVRRVDGVEGDVAMRWSVHPGTRFNSAQPWLDIVRGVTVIHVGDQQLALRVRDVGDPVVDSRSVSGRWTAKAGARGVVALTSSSATPTFIASVDDLDARVDQTVTAWHDWSKTLTYDGPWTAAVRRSALALKTLLCESSGAIAAAATTSLPERIGGDKNWDYRFGWIRDSSFTIDAFLGLGLHEEVQSSVSWLLQTLRASAPKVNVFYTLAGEIPGGPATVDAPGYRDSDPVHAGNGAGTQTQLGVYGDLFDTVWRYAEAGHVLDPASAHLLEALADQCCDLWRTKDAGLWELKSSEHYTISKIGCWTALDRATRLHQSGHLPTGHPKRWSTERDLIKAWVDEHCWSAAKNSYTFYAGTDDLDAATLLAGRTGFDRGARLAGTVDAVARELTDGPAVYRYTGMAAEEGAFVACTFWLVHALVLLGRRDHARELMDGGLRLTNDLGLLSEQWDPHTGELLGNLPQGLSHLALINAALAYHDSGAEESTDPAAKP